MNTNSFYVYILSCEDGSYYIGVTNDLDRRFQEHVEGFDPACYTYTRRPLILRYFEEYDHIVDAITREKQLKGWSRAKKEALIKRDFALLKQLAKSKG